LVQASPKVFSLGGWSHQGWTNIDLGNIDEHTLRNVIRTAWRNVAPKTVVAAFDEIDNREL
jgi:hypothetical protein